ncbi:hypothetical protein M569_11471 [Genlisea aurea]|uniref:Cytochrome b561 and DOMON domain-containing protein n=1 Tax=Genlisea aurea TaxID=192259 RepID=S8DK71_9LAMI|nr:hypothetical protein M569_11471 [Genlisea aurea]
MEEEAPRFQYFIKPCFFFFFFIFAVLIDSVFSELRTENQEINNGGGVCNKDLSPFLPFPYGNLPHMICKPFWNSYLLRYSKSSDDEITIVLSTIYTTGWVGMGFSPDGKMINSSCMVAWVDSEGRGRIKQYHVDGYTPSEIKPDDKKGRLPLTNIPPFMAVNGATIYMAFQLKFNESLSTAKPILLAFSTKNPHHLRLTVHEDKTTINFDFSTGSSSSSIDSSPKSIFKEKTTHGTLAVLSWGIFLPIGAISARYLKNRDPLWYYLHVVVQFIGFILGVAAIAEGLALNDKIHGFIPTHRGIGIFILTLTILQVLAFFWRPQRDSKYRKHWRCCHGWLGRICLLFGAVNIGIGIHIAAAGAAWKISYGFLVGSLLVAVIIFEALLYLQKSRDVKEFSMKDMPM